MASVFTYDPNPPRLSSPWLSQSVSGSQNALAKCGSRFGDLEAPRLVLLADYGITKLEAEPQEGPVEYKLHLLLRPRRSFSTSSTGQHVSGSNQSRSRTPRPEPSVAFRHDRASPISIPSIQSRQSRLQHLTTQLLWRLQQSSPYHSSSTANLVLPVLPEAFPKPSTLGKPERLLPGLEESQGALYEIGVSDDGTFVGLTKDELEESLATLRSMAASLGCRVQVLRSVIVGDCEWIEEHRTLYKTADIVHVEKLWVAEAFVVPKFHQAEPESLIIEKSQIDKRLLRPKFERQARNIGEVISKTEQLRVSLTGSTTSGKSSLLGTLSTSTLDNGRGKSRLSLLKHRHEIASGVTSSVAPELIGYQTSVAKNGEVDKATHIVNYGSDNISSWIDIHDAAEGGRLVYLTDSAGHPRYRRTTVRGLVSWAPHWTLCCVAADADEDTVGQVGATASAKEILGVASTTPNLSMAHLELCLKLGLPLTVVITKFDLASKGGLRQTLAKVLSLIKATGRQPVLTKFSHADAQELSLSMISLGSKSDVQRVLAECSTNEHPNLVPIVFTSVVTGTGIGTLHALLHHLPIPELPQPQGIPTHLDEAVNIPGILFHVDEVFTKLEKNIGSGPDCCDLTMESSYVLSGHLRYGSLSVGDKIVIGPFLPESAGEDAKPDTHHSRSYPGHFRDTYENGTAFQDAKRPSSSGSIKSRAIEDRHVNSTDIWQQAHVVSIRNLRLPVQKLLADQVGTIGITFGDSSLRVSDSSQSSGPKIRKGMILAQSRQAPMCNSLEAYGGFLAHFDDIKIFPLAIRTSVVVHISSIRASARVTGIKTRGAHEPDSERKGLEDVFGFEDNSSDEGGVELPLNSKSRSGTQVAFQFLTCREWIEIGIQVLIMPERNEKNSVGLEGFVGTVTRGIT